MATSVNEVIARAAAPLITCKSKQCADSGGLRSGSVPCLPAARCVPAPNGSNEGASQHCIPPMHPAAAGGGGTASARLTNHVFSKRGSPPHFKTEPKNAWNLEMCYDVLLFPDSVSVNKPGAGSPVLLAVNFLSFPS